jgi:hypothetical protein
VGKEKMIAVDNKEWWCAETDCERSSTCKKFVDRPRLYGRLTIMLWPNGYEYKDCPHYQPITAP